MIKSVKEQKEEVIKLILPPLKEIIYVGLRVDKKSIGTLEDDIRTLMRALQLKNKIYDFEIDIKPNLGRYDGKIIFSLVNTENMGDNASEYEEEVDFSF